MMETGHLSRMEKRVLLYLAAGNSVPRIAELLDRAPSTIESHAKAVRKKLEARNAVHAIAIAFSSGILDERSLDQVQAALALRHRTVEKSRRRQDIGRRR